MASLRGGERVIARATRVIQRRIDKIINASGPAAGRALNRVAADLLERSSNVAPILRGDLIRTGRITRVGSTQRIQKRQVSYGTDHAIFTHEGSYNLGPVSRLKPDTEDGPVGRKYLDRPFRRNAKRYRQFVIDEMKVAATLRRRGGKL